MVRYFDRAAYDGNQLGAAQQEAQGTQRGEREGAQGRNGGFERVH